MIKKINKKSHLGVTLLNESHKEESVEQVVFEHNLSSFDDSSSNKVIKKINDMTITSTTNNNNVNQQHQHQQQQQPYIGPYFSPSYQFSTSTSTLDQAKYHQYLSSLSQQQIYHTPMLTGNNYINCVNMNYGIPQQPIYYLNYQSMNYVNIPQHHTLYPIPQPISYYSFNNPKIEENDKKQNKQKKDKNKSIPQEPKKSFKTQSDNAITSHKRKKNTNTSLKIKAKVTDIEEYSLSLAELINSFNSKRDFINYICTSKGSKEVQTYLIKATPNVINTLIDEIGSKFEITMTNHYANHFFKNFTNNCNSEQKLRILKYIEPNFSKIAHHSCGTHAMQSLLEIIDNDEEIQLITSCIKNDLIRLCKVRLLIIKYYSV